LPPVNYQQTLDYLYSFIDYENLNMIRATANYDLRRVDELLGLVGNPHLKARTVHIAGTKGKGSTAAMVASALTASGYKTGLYTSPHLYDITERFCIDSEVITKNELIELTKQLKPQVVAVNYRATYGKLTTFEIMTVLAFLYCANHRAEFQVIETGLGGRLDATNVVKPELCLLSRIDLDHTEVLGGSLKAIAEEKAGIIKEGVTVISVSQQAAAMKVIKKAVAAKNTTLITIGKDVNWENKGFEGNRQLMLVKGRLAQYALSLPFAAYYQQENATLAVAALETLKECGFDKITPASIVVGLERTTWRGRFQILRGRSTVILDGAHNKAAACALADSLKRYLKARLAEGKESFSKTVLLLGVSNDKDFSAIAKTLKPFADEVIVTASRHPRAMPSDLLVKGVQRHKIKTESVTGVDKALAEAQRRADAKGLVLVTGSLFVVGEALKYLEKEEGS